MDLLCKSDIAALFFLPMQTPKQCGWVRYKIHELGGRVRRGTWKDGFALLLQGFLQFYEDEAHVNGLETPVLTFCVINGAVSDAEGFTKKNHAILISGSQFIMRKKGGCCRSFVSLRGMNMVFSTFTATFSIPLFLSDQLLKIELK